MKIATHGKKTGAALILCFGLTQALQASIVTFTPSPAAPSEFQARIRWGGTGWEGAIIDSSPAFDPSPTLNPVGTPVWQANQAYKFEVTYDGSTGTVGLKVDFNRDLSFSSDESISRSLFVGTTSYAGVGFSYLSIAGNESDSTARSTVTDLSINGSGQSAITPNGTFSETFYRDNSSSPLNLVTISGNLTFTTSGTTDERPSWTVFFRSPVATVPDGGTTLAMMGLGLSGLALARRKAAR